MFNTFWLITSGGKVQEIVTVDAALDQLYAYEGATWFRFLEDWGLSALVDGVEVIIPSPVDTTMLLDWPTLQWLPDLEAAREATRLAWNAWRDRELIAGYAHNGHVFHADDRFIGEIQMILKGYERGFLTGTSAIRTRDNGTIQMTHMEIETLLLLIGLHRQAVYQQSWTGKDALEGLTTLEAIMQGGPPA